MVAARHKGGAGAVSAQMRETTRQHATDDLQEDRTVNAHNSQRTLGRGASLSRGDTPRSVALLRGGILGAMDCCVAGVCACLGDALVGTHETQGRRGAAAMTPTSAVALLEAHSGCRGCKCQEVRRSCLFPK